jgi:DNA-binding PadR family transcriptional regulator
MDINKDLIAASATPLVLAILAEGDSYGYAILRRVSELSGGELHWTDGMLYPVLHRLEGHGYIKGKWGTSETGRKRKYYHLTARGQAQLGEQCHQWNMVDAALRNIWSAVSLPARSALSPLPSHG